MAMMRLRREDPRVVGSFRLHRRLGSGGMGVVYLGSDKRGQKVALKLIRPELAEDKEFRTRFAREVAAAARIRGGCTARLVAADIEADRPWLATAYVPGPSLYAKVMDEGPLPWPEIASIGAALADGLVHVHEAGVVHRDLKPSNILLSPKGPRIIDFGIAWSTGASTLTHVGTAVGSPGFLAPEQVRGVPVTAATDVFALGSTLAYAATGDSPFGSGSSEVMLYRVVHEEPDLSAVPGPLAPLIRACLAKEPADRPGTGQLHERLRELAARGSVPRAERRDRSAAREPRDHGDRRDPPVRTERAQPPNARPEHPERGGGRRPADQPHPQVRQTPAMRRGGELPPTAPLTPPESAAGHPGQARTGHPHAGHARAGQGHAGHPHTGQAAAGAAHPGHTATGPAPGPQAGQSRAGQGASGKAAQRTPQPHVRTPAGSRSSAGQQHTPAGRKPSGSRPMSGRPVDSRTPRPHGGRLSGPASRRLLRQRLIVFITVTAGVALAIAAAQGCQNRTARNGAPASGTAPVTAGAVDVAQGGAATAGSDAIGSAAAAPVDLSSAGTGPQVDWSDRVYPDPSGGPAIRLSGGRADTPNGSVALTTVLPAAYHGAPAAVVVLTRQNGGVPQDLVELYGFAAGHPVLRAARASTGDPGAVGSWRLSGGAVVREERSRADGHLVAVTRYTARGDGTLDESWPGSGTSATPSATAARS